MAFNIIYIHLLNSWVMKKKCSHFKTEKDIITKNWNKEEEKNKCSDALNYRPDIRTEPVTRSTR